MSWRRELSRLRALFRRPKLADDLKAEIRSHLEMEERENLESGMPPDEARYAALRRFGNVILAEERSREMWIWNTVETLLQDLRYGLRQLRRNPGFTAVVIITLALGIGANTAIFSVLNTVLLKTLPVREPERLAVFGKGLNEGIAGGNFPRSGDLFSYLQYKQLRDHNQVFQGLCAFGSTSGEISVKLNGAGGPAQQAQAELVSGNFFTVLGVNAFLGRTFTPDEDRVAGEHPVAVLSYRYWTKAFSRSPAVVGRTIDVNSTAFTIIGVTPPEFFGVKPIDSVPDMWLPVSMQPQITLQRSFLNAPDTFWLTLIGRLKPALSRQQAQAVVNLHLRQLLIAAAGTSPSKDQLRRIAESRIKLTSAARGISDLREQFSTPLQILMIFVGLVLLIACANVANLLLSRAAGRRKEISMRWALGATRMRLVRQLLTESVLLAVIGGAAGLLLASWGTTILVRLISGPDNPLRTSLDPAVLLFAFSITAGTGVLFGLAPALRSTRFEIAPALKEGGKNAIAGPSGKHRFDMGKALAVFQVALSLLLLVGAGLFVRSLEKLEHQDLGFNPNNVLLVNIDPRLAGYKPSQLASLYQRLLDHINSLPGVQSAALAGCGIDADCEYITSTAVEGYTPAPGENMSVQMNLVSPRYFKTMGMSMLLGRAIGLQDTASSPKVAVINQAMARHFFHGGDPSGRKLNNMGPTGTGIEIVGVVKDAKVNTPRENAPRMIFLPLMQQAKTAGVLGAFPGDLEIRAILNPASLAPEVRRAITEVDKNLPITGVKTLNEQVSGSLTQERTVAELSSFFGFLALLLACVGLYGLMSYAVARRTNEIGIRMAVGAQKNDVLGLVVGQGMVLALIGAGTGIIAALGLTRLMASLLYGVRPTDPLTFIAVSLILIAVALLACYIPARRATKVDPMVALRYE
ncbi:MAG TPA: ABC transporter permease [Terriglobia bacterium]|nr:ABC transporter permease [Terriglobia bacterium]